MLDVQSRNPYEVEGPRINGFQEVPGAVLRLRRSFRQREFHTPESAQPWLDNAVNACVEGGFFSENARGAKVEKKIGSGFNTSIFLFNADDKKWVMKLGAKSAPVPGWFDPSSREYAQWYSHNLGILQEAFQNSLPHLIPLPQRTLYVPNDQSDYRSIIIQPYTPFSHHLRDMHKLPRDAQKSLLHELTVFYEQCKVLYKQHKFIPDLANGNLGIKEVNGEYHLSLIDNGMIDFKAVSPVLNWYSNVIYNYRLRRNISRLQRSA